MGWTDAQQRYLTFAIVQQLRPDLADQAQDEVVRQSTFKGGSHANLRRASGEGSRPKPGPQPPG